MYVSVYDPSVGFVTGGGWVNSPQSALYEYMHTAGKASFGLVARYTKNSRTQVDGNTQFQIETGSFALKSSSHDDAELVINGNRATYKGKGTVTYKDASGNTVTDLRHFGFRVAATDGHYEGGTGPDKYRIMVWTLNADGSRGQDVYDNQVGCEGANLDENAEACTVLGGGSIVIHNLKPSSKSALMAATPKAPGLEAYPTAFSDRATIAFALEQSESYSLELYDLKGSLVRKVATGTAEAGRRYEHEVAAQAMGKGLYLARLTTGTNVQTVKLIVQQ